MTLKGRQPPRHVLLMNRVFLVLITAAAALQAQEPPPSPESSAITSVLAAMNKALQKPDVDAIAGLFSKDGDLRIAGGVLAGPRTIAERLADRRPWSEVTPPRIEHESVRLVTPDVAMVDASWVQYGSTIMRRAQSVMLLLRKEGAEWRVASLRVAAPTLAEAQ